MELPQPLAHGQAEIAEAKLAALRAYEADPYLRDANKTIWRLFQSSLDLEDAVESAHWCDEGSGGSPTILASPSASCGCSP